MLGKHHSEKTKKQISDSTNAAKAKIRAKMESIGRWIPLDQLTDFSRYKRTVWVETNKNLHLIPNYDKAARGRNQLGSNHHQVDHIISITDGFKQGIPPELLGNIANLCFIPWKDNLQKWHRSEMTLEEFYEILKEEHEPS